MDAAFDERLRLRQVNVIPDNIDVSRVTGMAQPIAEIDHLGRALTCLGSREY
jgi:hypothetical protein